MSDLQSGDVTKAFEPAPARGTGTISALVEAAFRRAEALKEIASGCASERDSHVSLGLGSLPAGHRGGTSHQS